MVGVKKVAAILLVLVFAVMVTEVVSARKMLDGDPMTEGLGYLEYGDDGEIDPAASGLSHLFSVPAELESLGITTTGFDGYVLTAAIPLLGSVSEADRAIFEDVVAQLSGAGFDVGK